MTGIDTAGSLKRTTIQRDPLQPETAPCFPIATVSNGQYIGPGLCRVSIVAQSEPNPRQKLDRETRELREGDATAASDYESYTLYAG